MGGDPGRLAAERPSQPRAEHGVDIKVRLLSSLRRDLLAAPEPSHGDRRLGGRGSDWGHRNGPAGLRQAARDHIAVAAVIPGSAIDDRASGLEALGDGVGHPLPRPFHERGRGHAR